MFHLVTHAFFKALLFLGAGVVIHALDDEQDIRKMGGMGRYLPYTTALMWIGALALAGVPPFSGFFSKDQILADALARGDWVGYIGLGRSGCSGAFVTALYTFRLMLLVFHGEPSDVRAPSTATAHAGHGEGPISMLWTIGVLAVGATLRRRCSRSRASTHGMRNFLEPTVPARRRGDRRPGARAPPCSPSRSRSSASSSPTRSGAGAATRRGASPRATAPLERVLAGQVRLRPRSTTGLFYRPAVGARARSAQRLWEEPRDRAAWTSSAPLGALARAGCSRRAVGPRAQSTRS